MIGYHGRLATRGLLTALVLSSSLVACNQRPDPSEPIIGELIAEGQYRILITIDSSQIEGTGTLANFPVLVILDQATTPDVFVRAQADGSDIRFTAANGSTPLDFEIVSFDAQSGKAEIWVRANQLSKTQNQFYLTYGDPAGVGPPPDNIWAEYAGVYHFEDDPAGGVLRDATPAAVDGVTLAGAGSWTSGDRVPGQVGKAWYYDGGVATRSSKLCVPGMTYTLSGWANLTTRSTDFFIQSNPCFWHLSTQASDVSWSPHYQTAMCGHLSVSWMPQAVVLNEWHHWLWVFSEADSSISLYYDGEFKPVYTIYPGPPQGPSKWTPHPINPDASGFVGIFGPYYANGWDEMAGYGDEFRVRPGVLSPEWIKTEYRNQRSPLTFVQFGPEEPVSVVEQVRGSSAPRRQKDLVPARVLREF